MVARLERESTAELLTATLRKGYFCPCFLEIQYLWKNISENVTTCLNSDVVSILGVLMGSKADIVARTGHESCIGLHMRHPS